MATPAFAQDAATDVALIATIGALLGKLLLVLLLLESAMSALFNWRVYRIVLSGRAWKTPIMFGLGLLVVICFHYDFIDTAITGIAGGTSTAGLGWVSTVLSAMVIAGGSQGIHDLLKKLGLRSPLPDTAPSPRLGEDQAWLALRITRRDAVGDIQIMVTPTDRVPDQPLVGSVDDRPLGRQLAEAFGMIGLRFPRTGGLLVKPNITYDIALSYKTASDPRALFPVGSFAFAPRAIVDLDVTA
ncbi:MAG: hypothetical protein WAT09_00545 [Paracoccaceae bacterium]